MAVKRGRVVSNAEFARLWADKYLAIADIGRELGGISHQAVVCRARARGLPPRPGRRFVIKVDEALFARMWTDNVRLDAIQHRFGMSQSHVRRTRVRLGLPDRKVSRWHSLSLDQWHELQIQRAMHEAARAEQDAARKMWTRAA